MISTLSLARLVSLIVELTNVDESEFDVSLPMSEQGVTSVLGVDLVDRINDECGLDLGSEVIYDYPTAEDLASVISDRTSGAHDACFSDDRESACETLQRIAFTFLEPGTTSWDPTRSWDEIGFNSVDLMDLVDALNEELGTELGPEVIFDFNTPRRLAEHLESLVDELPESDVGIPSSAFSGFSCVSKDAVAIIGMSMRFADLDDVSALESALWQGESRIGALSSRSAPNLDVSGGFIPSPERFDAPFFGISAREARRMDPQQRLLLEEAYRAVEDSGRAPDSLAGTSVGIFVGARSGDYGDQVFATDGPSSHVLLGNDMAVLSGRLANWLGVTGPCLTIDAACASSLAALHLASDSIRRGECGLAIAAGVFVASPRFLSMASAAGLLSTSGQCRPFSEEADGMVLGDGAGVLVLKPLVRAIEDGDHIHAVVRASAMCHNGGAPSLMAPVTRSMRQMIVDLYRNSGTDITTVGCVEAQGSGSRIGDSAELAALTAAFKDLGAAPRSCVLGSTKANVGHSVAASGMAAIAKVITAFRRRHLPEFVGVMTPHRHLGHDDSPFIVSSSVSAWPSQKVGPLRAGVNSYAFNGVNAHVILEEYVPSVKSIADDPPYLIPVSARTPSALRSRLVDLRRWLEDHDDSLGDVAYTLQVGRQHHALRKGFVVDDRAMLRDRIDRALTSGDWLGARGDVAMQSQDSTHKDVAELVHPGASCEELAALADLYCAGAAVPFQGLHVSGERRRLSMPGYRFDDCRYWLADEQSSATSEVLTASVPVAEKISDSPTLSAQELQNHEAAHKELTAWALATLFAVLSDAADGWSRGMTCTVDELAESLGVIDRHRRHFEHVISMFVREGILQRTGERVEIVREADPMPELDRRRHALDGEYPEAAVYTPLLALCFDHYPKILSGRTTSVEVLFPGVSDPPMSCLYANNQMADLCNDLVAWWTLRYVTDNVPADRSIGIVELGAGTGSTTLPVLHALTSWKERIDYAYTDLSLAFRTWGEKKFQKDFPCVRFARLDISAPPAAQGFSEGAADVVIAANVIHTTPDIRASVRHVYSMLRPGGVLILNELTGCPDIYAIVTGLLDGWWLFQDPELRIPESPLLDLMHWKSVLSDEGFDAMVVPGPATGRYGVAQSVIVATRPVMSTRAEDPPHQAATGEGVGAPDSGRSNRGRRAVGRRGLLSTVLSVIAAVIEEDESSIGTDIPFMELGIDSLVAPEMIVALNDAFGVQLRASVLFEHSTVDRLVDHLFDIGADVCGDEPIQEQEMMSASTEALTSYGREMRESPRTFDNDGDAIAIIGMSCTFPDARDPQEYWDNIVAGRCSIRDIPLTRWDVDKFYDPDPERLDRSYCRVGGVIPDAELFDPLFFRMSGRDAEIADPQQRVFLEHAWKALEDSGHTPASVGGSRCGVFVGCVANETSLINELEGVPADPGSTLGSYSSVLAARISYFLNLHGPSISIDTACSSSLVSLHLAAQSLRAGETDMALVGGVFVAPSHRFHVAMSNMLLLSPTGACRPFDCFADGFIPGEGAGVLVLKPLTAAQRDGDHVLAVIRGTAVNHDGASNGFTAPSAQAQTDLASTVYRRAGIDVRTIGYAEAHGTGTRLGDAVEAEALTAAHRQFTAERNYCALGSVKASIGHAAAAAGVAGVIKAVQALRHAIIPPTWHMEHPNELMSWDESPFYFPSEEQVWRSPEQGPRRATVSSFGLSGTNAHVLLEEAPEGVDADRGRERQNLVVVSGHTPNALRLNEEALLEWLEGLDSQGVSPTLEAIARTTQLHRMSHDHRVAVLASSRAELMAHLRDHLRDVRSEAVFAGHSAESQSSVMSLLRDEAGRDFLSGLVRRRRLEALAKVWVDGLDVPWADMYEEPQQALTMPPYRFDHMSYPLRKCAPNSVAAASAPGEFRVATPAWIEARAPSFVTPPRRLLVLGDEDDLRAIRHRWPSTALTLVRAAPGERGVPFVEGSGTWRIDPRRARDFDELLRTSAAEGVVDVLNLWPLHEDSGAPVDRAIGASLRLVGAAGRTDVHVERIVCVTRRDGVPCPYDDAVAAVGHSADLVAPGLRFSLLRIDGPSSSSQRVDHALAEWGASDPEVLRRGHERFIMELAVPSGSPEAPIVIRRGAVCLVTGGLGALGLITSRHLANTHAAHLVVVGRSPLTSEAEARLSSLRTAGAASVHYFQADVSDRRAMHDVVHSVRELHGGVHAIVHAAGILDSRPLSAMDDPALESALKAKIEGVQVLDDVTRDEDMDAMILFSSASSVQGDFGLGGYGVANRFLDSYCEYRNFLRAEGARRGATVALDWPLWEDGGMRAGGQSVHLRAAGVAPLSTSEGLRILDSALAQGLSQVVVIPEHAHPDASRDTDLADATGTSDDEERAPAREQDDGEPSADLRAIVLEATARALGIDSVRLNLDADLANYGLDSVSLKTYARRLSEELGVPVSPTLFFACGTLGEVVRQLSEQHGDAIHPPRGLTVSSEPLQSSLSESRRPPLAQITPLSGQTSETSEAIEIDTVDTSIAVVGMAGRFPGARDIEEYWRNLADSVDSIVEVPCERWDWTKWYASEGDLEGRSNSKWGGFIKGVDEFDARFFHLSPLEAELMDPQQRLLLQTAWSAIEDAGWDPASLSGRRLGVFVGAQFNEYSEMLASAGLSTAQIGTGTEHSMLANRLSYLLDARGPSEVMDTACSGALVAVHRAIRSLRSGESELVLVGGVSLMLTPRYHILTTQMGVASPTGHCHTFGAAADGYVRGEGVGVLALKPLSRAVEDGDHVWAVLRGSAVGHGGHASSLSAPNPRAQADLLLSAWDDAGLEAADVSYIEAHGTGTELGDPVEVEGMTTAFRESARRSGREPTIGGCGIGSVKSQIGHLEPAAGVAGLVKVVLALRHGIIPGTLHALPRNPYLELERSPFRIIDDTVTWPAVAGDDRPRRAGVSSFGFGGANAHVVVEEFREHGFGAPDADGPHVMLLSARTDQQLRRYALFVADFLGRDVERRVEAVRVLLAEWLGLPFAELDGHATIGDLGMDVTSMARVTSRLRSEFGSVSDALAVGLDTTVRDLAEALPSTLRLADIAYSLAVGRTAYSCRFAASVTTMEQFVRQLREFAETGHGDGVAVGTAGRQDDIPDGTRLEGGSDWEAAEAWVLGADVDWSRRASGRRVSLPTYPFEPTRHWFESPAPTPDAELEHPFSGRVDDGDGVWSMTTSLSGDEFYLRDHIVQGTRTLPGVAYLEMARLAAELHAGRPVTVLKDFIWARPVVVGSSPVVLRTTVTDSTHDAMSIEFTSDEGVHARATCVPSQMPADEQPVDVEAIRRRVGRPVPGSECYDQLCGSGLEYGPSFRCLQELWSASDEALARWARAPRRSSEEKGWTLDPAILDGALHTLLSLVDQTSGHPLVPFTLGEVHVSSPLPDIGWVHATRDLQTPGRAPRFDIRIMDDSGTTCALVRGLALRQIEGPRTAESTDEGYSPDEILAFVPSWVQSDLGRVGDVTLPAQVLCVGVDSQRLEGRLGPDIPVEDATVEDVFHVCRDLVTRTHPGRLLIVTDRTDSVGEGLAGLARTCRLENPELVVSVVQTDAVPETDFIRQELVGGAEDVLVLRADDGRYRGSLREIDLPRSSGRPFRKGAIAVISGGRGQLGRALAEHLVALGAGGLVLLGRSAVDSATQNWATGLGVPVMLERADVSNAESTDAALRRTRDQFGGIHVVVHAAGMIQDGALARKTDQHWREVVEPKVRGAEVLDELTAEDDLDLVVLFSSCSGILGNKGQADYAYANCRMDAFAARRQHLVERRLRSGRTVSVAWPLWRDGGMPVNDQVVSRLRQEIGMIPMPTRVGLEIFDAAVQSGETRLAVMYGDAPMLRERIIEDTRSVAPLNDAPSGSGERELIQVVADLLKVDAAELDPAEDITNYGVDSIMMISLMKAIEKELGVVVDPGILAEQSTIRGMVDALGDDFADHYGAGAGAEESSPPAPAAAHGGTHDSRLAVIGMAGRFPGASTLEGYWRNLADGRDVIQEIPADRWSIDGFYSPDKSAAQKSYSRWAGFLDNIYGFDAARYRISDADALAMDPAHRILLELADELWSDAGYTPAELSGTRTGVFIGGGESNYVRRVADQLLPEYERKMVVNTIPNMMAARVSDVFDLRGPAQVIDTACSSSLVAVHEACRAVLAGDCDQAVVGGIELLVDGYLHTALSKAEVLSDDGVCYVFDERAKGMVLGEGAGLLLIKSYQSALRDGDDIRAVILGSAINNDGRTMGLTVPSAEGQEDVLRRAYEAARVSPASISYLEAHGSGTLLGDPIEIRAASKVLGEYGNAVGYCGVGSVKSNLGHLLRAAAMPSVVKVVLALQHRMLPPTLHCEHPHPRFRFVESPFYPVTELRQWDVPQGDPRRAGISSFGFGGTNAHAVFEEFIAPAGFAPSRTPRPTPMFLRKEYRRGLNKRNHVTETAGVDECDDDLGQLLDAVRGGQLAVDQAVDKVKDLR